MSMTATPLSMCGSCMYLLSLAKICSSGLQLTMNLDGKILCTSQMFTFLSLPVGPETSNCLVPIHFAILKLGTILHLNPIFYQNV